jgi:hypothetical protein
MKCGLSSNLVTEVGRYMAEESAVAKLLSL